MSTEAVSTFFALSAIAIVVLAAANALLWAFAPRWRDTVAASLGPRALPLAWLVALVAMLGSLYYSEIADYTPCEYCWYQRIAMYPLVVLLGIAALRKDGGIRVYALPLAGIGAGFSAYHYLLQHFPELASGSCSATAPCSAAWVWEFGFVSIPFMAFACFAAIASLLLVDRSHARLTAVSG